MILDMLDSNKLVTGNQAALDTISSNDSQYAPAYNAAVGQQKNIAQRGNFSQPRTSTGMNVNQLRQGTTNLKQTLAGAKLPSLAQ